MASTVQRVIAVGGARGVLRGVATTRHQPMWWRSVACAALPQAGRRRCSGAAPIGGHGRFTHTTTRSPSQQQQQPQAAAATADIFTAKQHADSPPGIFGVPALHTPDDFDVLAHKVIEECKQLLRALVTVEPGLTTLQLMDAVSDVICCVIDAATCCRNLHSNDEWKRAADKCVQTLGRFISSLNTMPELEQAISRVANDKAIMESFTEEQRRVAILHQRELQAAGAGLSENVRNRIVELQALGGQLEWQLDTNVHEDTAKLYAVPRRALDSLPANYINRLPSQDPSYGPGKATLSTDAILTQGVLQFCVDDAVRHAAMKQSLSIVEPNLEVVEQVVHQRHDTAKVMGFDSYAELTMRDRIMQSPQEVFDMLVDLFHHSQPKVEQEVAQLQRLKDADTGSNDPLRAWDIPYYKRQFFEDAGINERGLNEALRTYLQLDDIIEGAMLVAQRLFGIEMDRQDVEASEAWTAPRDLRKYIVRHNGEAVGTLYMDLHSRPHKYSSSVMYTLRCGRGKYPWEVEQQQQQQQQDGGYQHATVNLVCGMAMSLVSLRDAVNFFHEFGHAMHALLSRTEFQHVSGIRCAQDLVETPSTLFEYFVRDHRVLSKFAHHHVTREPVPYRLLQQVLRCQNAFSGLQMQHDIAAALFDLTIFGGEEFRKGRTSRQIWEDIQSSFNPVSWVPGTFWYTQLTHLNTYGAGYYSYILSRINAAALWRELFRDDPLSTETGQRYRELVLQHGGAREPRALLRDALGGRDVAASDVLQELGLSLDKA